MFGLMHWLNAQEDGYQLILYECDFTATNWTRRCLRQADTILVVGLGDQKPPKRQLVRIRDAFETYFVSRLRIT
jgi:hypothetical protein